MRTSVSASREERERHAAAAGAARQRREEALDTRRRAEVRLAIDEARAVELDTEVQHLVGLQAERAGDLARVRERLAAAAADQERAAAALASTEAAGTDARDRREAADAAASAARERLREAEARARAAEVAAMAAQLQLDSGREGLLVELAGIGADGLRALAQADVETDPDTLATALEEALDATLAGWAADASDPDAGPSAARLGSLRRRYHELGAGNPFAAQELAEVRERLDGLEITADRPRARDP